MGGLWTVDLNADLGETAGDLELLDIVTSANVACGGHAGDAGSMVAAVEAARARGVVIGAHPSYRDREGVGRRELGLGPEEIAVEVKLQVGLLTEIADAAGARVAYVKLHGALYHRAAHDRAVAEAVLDALDETTLRHVLAEPGSEMLRRAIARGFGATEEGYCDRTYRADGMLVPRGEPDALLESPEDVAAQAVSLADSGRFGSLCVHGDTPGAVDMARRTRAALEAAGLRIRPFTR